VSTFLELCADLTRESGAIGTAPSSVAGQTGRQQKCVEWIIGAWRDIQNSRRDWTFLRAEWSGSLTASNMTYTGVALGISRFGEFLGDRPGYHPVTVYDPVVGQDQEIELAEIGYDIWKYRYDRRSHDARQPHEYCIAPDRSIRFGPKPDKTYTVRGEYRKAAQTLAANGDEPDMPERFHELIVWRAIMLMSDADEAVQSLALARSKYAALYRSLVTDCTPRIIDANSIA
jgi:hypothetical protein